MKWLNKNPQDWFYAHQIQQDVGAFADGAFLDELHRRDFILRTIAQEDEYEPLDEYSDPPYSYRISDFGRAYLEALRGVRWDTYVTRLLAIYGAITGTVTLVQLGYSVFVWLTGTGA